MGSSAMARRYGSACFLSESTSVNDGGGGFGGLVELEDCCCWLLGGPSGGWDSCVVGWGAGGAGVERSGEGGAWVGRGRFEVAPFWWSEVWVE
jgi:hypothetical protein